LGVHESIASLQDGRRQQACDRRVARCMENNRYVPAYLLGTKEIPMDIPTSYRLGDDSEAVLYAVVAMSLWDSVPGAIEWLRKTTGELAG
jgi:hypothetical protein